MALIDDDEVEEIGRHVLGYRGCYLRDRYQDIKEQRKFQERISDSLLEHYSREAVAVLFFMTRSGNFKRAETKWVDWFPFIDARSTAVNPARWPGCCPPQYIPKSKK
nr:hypothetical protein [Pseudomonas sp. L13]